MMVFSYPLMVAVQEISARIGRITGTGLTANMKKYFPRPFVAGVVLLVVVANICNIGADIGAMGDCATLLLPGPSWIYIAIFGLGSLLLQVFVTYKKYVDYLKWLTLAVMAYILTAFFVHVPWQNALKATFWPSISWHPDYFKTLIAVLGTTISPYLFFWQAGLEVEDLSHDPHQRALKVAPGQATRSFARIRMDTAVGMAGSNVVGYFIMLAAAVTFFMHQVHNVESTAQAAKALEPFAGQFASLLFATGVIGTSLLAVPTLAGASAYAVGELMNWRSSLSHKPQTAPHFYGVLIVATLVGISLNLLHLNPIKALFWSAIFNGIAAVPIMVVLMVMTSQRRIMGKFLLPCYLQLGGWFATGVMLAASLGMFYFLFASR